MSKVGMEPNERLDQMPMMAYGEPASSPPVLPSRRHFLEASCAALAASFSAAQVSAEPEPSGMANSSAPFAPGLTVTRIESFQLPAIERAFLVPIAAIWEFEVGNDTPVTKLHVTNLASDRRELADGHSRK